MNSAVQFPLLSRLRRFIAALGVLASVSAGRVVADSRPSFLILFADDQRADTLHAWGNQNIRTPNLDRLIHRGFGFRANYCFGSNSGAVCIPSRAMLMSGRTWLDSRHDLAGIPLMPERLGAAGYRTFATGKWHNGRESFKRAFQEGRSVFFGGMADHTKVPVVDYAGGTFGTERTATRFSSEEFASTAIQFLAQATNDAPFLCYVAFTAPHDPRNPLTHSVMPYYRNRPPLPANFLPQHPFDNGWMRGLRDENLAPYPRPPEMIRDQLAEYYGLITHLDGEIGRILEALKNHPRGRNTYVIYAADHGLAMGSHGLLGKQSLYEHSMKCPLVIAGPGIPAGRETRQFTYLFDIFPTVARLAGVDLPDPMGGRDLSPLWTGPKTPWRDTVFLPFTDTMRSIRDERWKLIVYPRTNHRQLFDLRRDPDERHNLAADPRHAATVARLEKRMIESQKQFGDRQPLSTQTPAPLAIDLSKDYVRKPDESQPAWVVEKYFRQGGR